MNRALDELFSDKQLKRDQQSLTTWGCDWTRSFEVAPSAIVFPESVGEVQSLVHWANAEGIPLVPSGGRTGLSGGAVASHGEVVVSFDRMNRILEFNAADRLVTCQAGVVTQMLQEFAVRKVFSIRLTSLPRAPVRLAGILQPMPGGSRSFATVSPETGLLACEWSPAAVS